MSCSGDESNARRHGFVLVASDPRECMIGPDVIYRGCCSGCLSGPCDCAVPSPVRFGLLYSRRVSGLLIRLSVNLVVVTPLCENMPGPCANKPGDMCVLPRPFPLINSNFLYRIYAINGKSVEIDNTDAEGRLILSGETLPLWCLLLVEP